MGVGAALVGAALIAGSTWYSTDQARKQAHESEDAAYEQAQEAARAAEELAKAKALRDSASAGEAEAIGELDLGEEESQRTSRSKGKQLFKIEQATTQAEQADRLQIGSTAPTTGSGVQL